MDGSWWVRSEQLDQTQKDVVTLPTDGSYLVTGPPGSGKSNLLLLRSKHLVMSKRPNYVLLTFNRPLEEFLRLGARTYGIDSDKIMTSTRWAKRLLKEYGVECDSSDDFQTQRVELVAALGRAVKEKKIAIVHDTILLDEGQDYWTSEIDVFRQLCKHLFVVADAHQKIYRTTGDAVDAVRKFASKEVSLKYHYRNGQKICVVADSIGVGIPGRTEMYPTCNYDELSYPSSVALLPSAGLDEQCALMVASIEEQLRAYPSDLLGVMVPKRDDLKLVWSAICESNIAGYCALQNDSSVLTLGEVERVWVGTIHGAKGLEFRASHVVAAEGLKKKLPLPRYLSYVATTRTKTALSVYRSGEIHGFFEEALLKAGPPADPPSLDDLFGGKP